MGESWFPLAVQMGILLHPCFFFSKLLLGLFEFALLALGWLLVVTAELKFFEKPLLNKLSLEDLHGLLNVATMFYRYFERVIRSRTRIS